MTGIRKRVTVGFLSIVVLLFFSGLVSLFELNNMSGDIDSILSSNRRSIELSENLLDAIREYDRAVINYAVFRDSMYTDSCRVCYENFSSKIAQAQSEATKSAAPLFDSLQMVASQLRDVVDDLRKNRRRQQFLL